MLEGKTNTPLIIQLEENPSTGYLWHIEPQTGMSMLSTAYTPHVNGEIGTGGIREFRMVFNQPNTYHVLAFQKREWESECLIFKNFKVNIKSNV